MKTTSWALALCACASFMQIPAQAQSSVTAFGLIDANVSRRQLAGEPSRITQSNGGLNTSFFGFRGTEDLGDGLKASFMLTSFFTADTGGQGRFPGDAFWSRAAWVGLDSERLGAVRLGRQPALAYQNLLRYSAFEGSTAYGPSAQHNYIPSAAEPMVTGSSGTDSNWNNTATYISPSWNGAVVSMMLAPREGTADGRRKGVGFNYQAEGPWNGGVVYEQVDQMNLNFGRPPVTLLMNRSHLLNAGTSYDFGVVKLYGQFVRTALDGTTSHIVLKTWQGSASIPVGLHRILAAYADTAKEERNAADQRRRTLSLAYNHVLSTRTDLYALVMHDRMTGLSNGTSYGAGIRHRF